MGEDGHSLLLPFDTDEPAFARGFELGILWSRLGDHVGDVIATVHVSSTEMILRMAEALNRQVTSVELDAFWMDVVFSPPCSVAGPSPGPDHL